MDYIMTKYALPIIFLLLINCNPNEDVNIEYDYGIRENKVTIHGYRGNKKNIIIPNYIKNYPVAIIARDAFYNNQLQSVVLPEYLEVISDGAFAYNQLTEIKFPESVSYIGQFAFAFNKLKSVSIPERVTHINPETFRFNELTSVNFHNNVQSIDYLAFQRNYLTEILLPDSLNYIGAGVFNRNKITHFTLPKNISEIGNIAFSGNLISTIIIHENIKKIGDFAFSNCDNLISVTFESTIPSTDFSVEDPFPENLRDIFYADDAENGTPGTYTREDGSTTWIRQL